ncbi:MAG: helix-turn-helix transcriptional regulator [Spirochaetales bacterium]|nr:helix-turn-helix transcriptional regulator [Spirochaetales bacterium]
MTLFRKIILLFFFIIPLSLLIIIVPDFLNRRYSIFPSKENLNYIETFTDSIRNGNSAIEDVSYDSEKLHIKYILKNSDYLSPDIFIIFWLDNKRPFIDLSHFTYITLRIKEAAPRKVTLVLKTFEPGFSSLDHLEAESLRHNEKVISLEPVKRIYKVDRAEFITPQWWYDKFNVLPHELGKELYTRVVSFDLHFIHSDKNPVEEVLNSIIIEEITFHRPIPLWSLLSAGFLVLYYLIFIVILSVKRLKKKSLHSLPGDKTSTLSQGSENELKRIINYIEENYNDPGISTVELQEKLGIPSLQIFKLIKQEYHMTFKQLINSMRIEESKRLLKESDLRIVEISYITGFKDSSYFNKVFKQLSGITPSEYRENK